jgi:hypothetical protein
VDDLIDAAGAFRSLKASAKTNAAPLRRGDQMGGQTRRFLFIGVRMAHPYLSRFAPQKQREAQAIAHASLSITYLLATTGTRSAAVL